MRAKEQHSFTKQSTNYEANNPTTPANNPPICYNNPQSLERAKRGAVHCSESSASTLAKTMSGINQARQEPTGYQKTNEKLHAIILC